MPLPQLPHYARILLSLLASLCAGCLGYAVDYNGDGYDDPSPTWNASSNQIMIYHGHSLPARTYNLSFSPKYVYSDADADGMAGSEVVVVGAYKVAFINDNRGVTSEVWISTALSYGGAWSAVAMSEVLGRAGKQVLIFNTVPGRNATVEVISSSYNAGNNTFSANSSVWDTGVPVGVNSAYYQANLNDSYAATFGDIYFNWNADFDGKPGNDPVCIKLSLQPNIYAPFVIKSFYTGSVQSKMVVTGWSSVEGTDFWNRKYPQLVFSYPFGMPTNSTVKFYTWDARRNVFETAIQNPHFGDYDYDGDGLKDSAILDPFNRFITIIHGTAGAPKPNYSYNYTNFLSGPLLYYFTDGDVNGSGGNEITLLSSHRAVWINDSNHSVTWSWINASRPGDIWAYATQADIDGKPGKELLVVNYDPQSTVSVEVVHNNPSTSSKLYDSRIINNGSAPYSSSSSDAATLGLTSGNVLVFWTHKLAPNSAHQLIFLESLSPNAGSSKAVICDDSNNVRFDTNMPAGWLTVEIGYHYGLSYETFIFYYPTPKGPGGEQRLFYNFANNISHWMP
jgi:hypothetical protein